MFNWFSLPTFLAMLLFWLLACYVVTRSPRSPVSFLAGAAQFTAAVYFLGQAMQANATTVDEWRPWARDLFWGATIALSLWYWLTVLLLREEGAANWRYLRVIAYPLGALCVLGTLVFSVAVFWDDSLYRWSSPITVPDPLSANNIRFHAPVGFLWPGFAALILGSTGGATLNLLLAMRKAHDEHRFRLKWLLSSGVFFLLGSNAISVINGLNLAVPAIWLSHVLFALALIIMAVNVTAYTLLSKVELLHRDLLYFLTVFGLLSLVYMLAFVLTGQTYSFTLLALLVTILIFAILTHALLDIIRRAFDHLFFSSEVQQLRADLQANADSAARTPDFDETMSNVQADLDRVSGEHLLRMTQEALRRLNTPSGLAQCQLLHHLSATVNAARAVDEGETKRASEVTPLGQAKALREILIDTIERFKPSADGASLDDPAALQYQILREEYILGMPNKQIMIRHSISEGTFHRNRREAINTIARELGRQEAQLAHQQARL